jgi:hypothetical protein
MAKRCSLNLEEKVRRKTDKIIVEISCTSEQCEALREQGLFFETIAEALNIARDDVREIDDDES